jgi:hypothetical protein
MAYYDAMIAKWATLNPGTTAAKLAALNAATATGAAIPMVIPTYKIYNLIDPTEFAALTAANQQLVRDILGMGTIDGSPGTAVRARIVAIFTNASGATRVALAALAALYDTPTVPWWQANGYARAFDMGDAAAAGVS